MIKLIGLSTVKNQKLTPNLDLIDFDNLEESMKINNISNEADMFYEEPVIFTKGNILYTAPELLTGVGKLGKADIYSYGVVLFWMITGC